MSSAQDFNQLANDKAANAAAIADSDPSINTVPGSAYTAVYADIQRYTVFTNAGAVAYTIPKDVFPIGAELEFEQGAAGVVTPTAAAGVTVGPGRGGAVATAGQGAVAMLKQKARNVWTFTGDIA